MKITKNNEITVYAPENAADTRELAKLVLAGKVLPELNDFHKSTHNSVIRNKGGTGSGHYGHAGRPGKVGGSLPGGDGNQKVYDLKDYLEGVSKLSDKSIEHLVKNYGNVYKPQELPDIYTKEEDKRCFVNAYRLAQENENLTYVEGFAFPDFIDIPIQHAWCVDKQGNVIDNTWKKAGTAYIGIPFNEHYMMLIMAKTGVYGMLGHHTYKYFENGIPEEAKP